MLNDINAVIEGTSAVEYLSKTVPALKREKNGTKAVSGTTTAMAARQRLYC